VLGGSSALQAVNVDPISRTIDFPVMLVFSLALIPLFWDGKLARWQGALLVIAYLVYIVYLFMR
jgi:Ca2+/Na+ antiporter